MAFYQCIKVGGSGDVMDVEVNGTSVVDPTTKIAEIDIPTTDIQTAVDEFETYNGGLLSSLKVSLTPNQDLHGYPEPWVGGAWKNKLPLVLADIKANNTSGTWSGNVYSYNGSTITVNTDESGNVTSIDVTNTPSAAIAFNLFYASGTFPFDINSTYTLNGCPSGGAGTSNYKLDIIYEKNGINNVLATDTGSGASANFNALVGATSMTCRIVIYTSASLPKTFYPMIRLATESDPTFAPYSNICPISGHTQVEVWDEGKNKIDAPDLSGVASNYIIGSAYVPASVNLPAGTYTLSFMTTGTPSANAKFAVVNSTSSDTTIANGDHVSGANSLTFTASSTITALKVYVNTSNAVDVSNIQIEAGSTATPYEPYNGYQVTVNLGGTYYSGTLDVVSGVLTVDMASVDLGTLNWSYGSDRFYTYGIASDIKRETSGRSANGLISSAYKADTGGADGTMFKGNDGALYIYNSAYNDASAFKTAMVGQTLVYELATHLTIQLSPTMVKALVGENHLSAPLEGQEITESKYKQTFTFDDVNVQIESVYSEGISHNSVYRGKYLGDHVTDEQWNAIRNGSFRDLYIGDYWTINGINWRIAHFNYWLGTGDVKCNTNHVVIVPYGWVSTFNMNSSDSTTGGYLNSEWYTTNRHFAVENIEADFGASHILSHRNFFSDAVSDGHASHGVWVDSTVDLMNEIMVCGSLIGSYLGRYYEVGCDKIQLALFKYNPPSIRMDVSYWLRGVSTESSFVAMGNFGLLDGFTASQILKIRPVFGIKA